MNHNPMQNLQARRLEEIVRRLCGFDRRAAHQIGTEETLHYLSGELERAQLVARLHQVQTLSAFEVKNNIQDAIENFAEANNLKKDDLKSRTDCLEKKKRLEIVNLFTQIGDPSGEKIIIGAHYDMDLFIEKGAGADDNASGVATVLQLAKNLKAHEKEFAEAGLCIEIVFFGAEETPFSLRGSSRYVDILRRSKAADRVKLMINLDMVGFFADDRDLDIWKGGMKFNEDDPFGKFMEQFKASLPKKENYYVVNSHTDHDYRAAELLVSLMRDQSLVTEHLFPSRLTYTVEGSRYPHYFLLGNFDAHSFTRAFIPSIIIHANPHRNKNYHTQNDLPETLDYTRMSKLTDGLEQFLLNFAQNRLLEKSLVS